MIKKGFCYSCFFFWSLIAELGVRVDFFWHSAGMLCNLKSFGSSVSEEPFLGFGFALNYVFSLRKLKLAHLELALCFYNVFRKNVCVILFSYVFFSVSCPVIFTVIINNCLHKSLIQWYHGPVSSQHDYHLVAIFFSNCTRGDACIMLFVVLIVAWRSIANWGSWSVG